MAIKKKSRKRRPPKKVRTATQKAPAQPETKTKTMLPARLTPKQMIENAKKETKPATATATGAKLAVLAGRPSKQAVIACFGKTGYALSWAARATRLNIKPETLCERFKTNPDGVKAAWAALSEKK
jgi:hypothetical protein